MSKHIDEQEEKDEDSSSDGAIWGFNYVDWLSQDKDTKEMHSLADEVAFNQRIAIKSRGYEVLALEVMNKLRNEESLQNDNDGPQNSGSNLDEHPELVAMGGTFEPVLPESELINGAGKMSQKAKNQLKAKMAAKFGFGNGSMSIQAMEEEYKKKMQQRITSPKERPRFRAVDLPKLTRN